MSRSAGLLELAGELYRMGQPRPRPIEKPTVLQFPVNDICNARCQMCNIWQQKLDHQISPAELARALDDPLFSQVRTVGVNGGEPTLRADLAELVEVLYRSLPNLRGVALITNAFKSEQVIRRIAEVGAVTRAHGGSLDVMVSLDGVGEVHDRVRGRPGNFANAVRVIDYIVGAELVDTARLGCTIIRANVAGLHDLLEFARQRRIYLKYRLGIPHQRLYSADLRDPFALSEAEIYHVAVFLENLVRHYERHPLQQHFYRSLIGQLTAGRPRSAGCDWQHRGATLTSRGELLYCAVASPTLGSALDTPANELYFANRDQLRTIVETACDGCLHDYGGLPPREAALPLLAARAAAAVERRLALRDSPLGLLARSTSRPLRQRYRLARRVAQLRKGSKNLPAAASAVRSPQQEDCCSSAAPRRVLLCGWYGTETLGDKAILGGVVRALRQALGEIAISLVSLEPYVSRNTVRQMPELAGCPVLTVAEGLDAVAASDLLVMAGGPLMGIEPLADLLALFERAAAAGVPSLLAGVGVGPLVAGCYRPAIARLLGLATARIYRDERSRQLARQMTGDSDGAVAEDPAFTWAAAQAGPGPARSAQPTLLLGLRDWPYTEYAADRSPLAGAALKARFEADLAATIERLLDQTPGLRLLPLPMCTNHHGGDDRWFYRELFRGRPRILAAADMDLLGMERSPKELLGCFGQAHAALTMRYHALVLALAAGTPVVALDYTLGRGKVAALARRANAPSFTLDQARPGPLAAAVAAALSAGRREPPPAPAFPQALARALAEIVQS